MDRKTGNDDAIKANGIPPSPPSNPPPTQMPDQPMDNDMSSAPQWKASNDPFNPSGQDEDMGPPPVGPFDPGGPGDDMGPPPSPCITPPPPPPGNPPQPRLRASQTAPPGASQVHVRHDRPAGPLMSSSMRPESVAPMPPAICEPQRNVQYTDHAARPAPYDNRRARARHLSVVCSSEDEIDQPQKNGIRNAGSPDHSLELSGVDSSWCPVILGTLGRPALINSCGP